MGSVSIAVGCAVGIPIGVGVLVVFFFWYRLQRRLKREEKEDEELNQIIHDDNGYISFDNLQTLQQQEQSKDEVIWQNKEAPQSHDSGLFEVRKISRQAMTGSGSSDGSVSQEEKNSHLAGSQENTRSSNQQQRQAPNNRKSKYFVPAYKRKLNAIQTKQLNMEGISTSNSSNASLESSQRISKKHINIYDQMIPVATNDGPTIFDDKGDKEFSHSNENLIKNLQNQNFGSYPTRASSSSLNQFSVIDPSSSSVNSTAKPGASVDNVFETPKSDRLLNSDEKLEKPDDVYLLKNNYDMMNTSEIAEEDQYENEFTNYTENKREFIDSLRPKKI